MPEGIPTAYVCETARGLLIVEADEALLFFRALRALRSVNTVGDLRDVDETLGLGLWESWDDLWSVVPTEDDCERFDQASDDGEALHHWRDHLATAHFAFEFPAEEMPRHYDEWLPEDAVEVMDNWMADGYLVKQPHAAEARALLREHGFRLVDEPALADAFGDQS
jgi:hypothetical protein